MRKPVQQSTDLFLTLMVGGSRSTGQTKLSTFQRCQLSKFPKLKYHHRKYRQSATARMTQHCEIIELRRWSPSAKRSRIDVTGEARRIMANLQREIERKTVRRWVRLRRVNGLKSSEVPLKSGKEIYENHSRPTRHTKGLTPSSRGFAEGCITTASRSRERCSSAARRPSVEKRIQRSAIQKCRYILRRCRH